MGCVEYVCYLGPWWDAKSWLAWMCVFMFYWQWSTLFPKPAAFHSYLILPLVRGPRHMHTYIKPHAHARINMHLTTDSITHTHTHTNVQEGCKFLLTLKSDGSVHTEIASLMKLSTSQTMKKSWNGKGKTLKVRGWVFLLLDQLICLKI